MFHSGINVLTLWALLSSYRFCDMEFTASYYSSCMYLQLYVPEFNYPHAITPDWHVGWRAQKLSVVISFVSHQMRLKLNNSTTFYIFACSYILDVVRDEFIQMCMFKCSTIYALIFLMCFVGVIRLFISVILPFLTCGIEWCFFLHSLIF